MPRKRPKDEFGTSQGHPGRLGRFMCKFIVKGQNVRGTDGTYDGTDGTYDGTDGTCPQDRQDTHQGVSRQNSLCLLVCFFPHIWNVKTHRMTQLLLPQCNREIRGKSREIRGKSNNSQEIRGKMGGNWQNSSEFPRDFLSIGRFSSDFSAALWRQELGQSGGLSHYYGNAKHLLLASVLSNTDPQSNMQAAADPAPWRLLVVCRPRTDKQRRKCTSSSLPPALVLSKLCDLWHHLKTPCRSFKGQHD